jgi:hypothetical protein
LVYATTKFIISVAGLLVYGLIFKLAVPIQAQTSKSLLIYGALVALTTYRDKFEKKIASQYDPSQLHFGRALLTPLIYVGFTLMMLLEQSVASFSLASIY